MDEPLAIIGLIGNTPLIRLAGASDATGCEILGKAEFLNPGQSVKDRAAIAVSREFRTARQCMMPIEGRGVVAAWDGRRGQLVVHSAAVRNVGRYSNTTACLPGPTGTARSATSARRTSVGTPSTEADQPG